MKKRIFSAMLALTMASGCVTTVHASETRRIQGYYANGYICTAYDSMCYPCVGAELEFNQKCFVDLDTKGTSDKKDDTVISGTVVPLPQFHEADGDTYPETLKVVGMNRKADVVHVMTAMGYKYSFKGCEDWEIGDGVSAIMHDNGTVFILDDYIVECKYGGWNEKNPFTDVKESDWFYDDVIWARENEVMTGLTEDTFAPNDTLTRAQVASIIYRIMGSPVVDYKSNFHDVAKGTWYSDAVGWASKNRIIAGYEDGNFGAYDPVTREQFATMMFRFGQYLALDMSGKTESLNGFSDAYKVSAYALEATQWAVGYGLISGKTVTELCPLGNTTRAECAAIVQRFMSEYRLEVCHDLDRI